MVPSWYKHLPCSFHIAIHDALSDITDTSDLITPSVSQISAVQSEDEISNSPREKTLENENESNLTSLTNIDITTSRGLSPNLPVVITENETLINLTETTTSATESITSSIESRGNTSMVSDSFIDVMDKISFDNISTTSTSFNPGFPKLVNGFSSIDMIENEAMNPSTKSFNFSVNEEKPIVVGFERCAIRNWYFSKCILEFTPFWRGLGWFSRDKNFYLMLVNRSRGVFRSLSNIYDEVFLWSQLTTCSRWL